MKTLKRIKGSKIEKELQSIIEQHEKFKSSYFWSPPGNASGRRSYEKQYSREPVVFRYKDDVVEINQSVDCSCKNIYYDFSVRVNDVKKDIRFLKKLVGAK